LQQVLSTCAVPELAPDRGDDLAAVVEVVDEANQRWMDCRRELHLAAQLRGTSVTEPCRLSNNC